MEVSTPMAMPVWMAPVWSVGAVRGAPSWTLANAPNPASPASIARMTLSRASPRLLGLDVAEHRQVVQAPAAGWSGRGGSGRMGVVTSGSAMCMPPLAKIPASMRSGLL